MEENRETAKTETEPVLMDADGIDSRQSASEGRKEDFDAEEMTRFDELGIGVLVCCRKKLSWFREKGSAVFEAECENCGTSYAMDPGYDYFEADEGDPGETYGRFVRRAS